MVGRRAAGRERREPGCRSRSGVGGGRRHGRWGRRRLHGRREDYSAGGCPVGGRPTGDHATGPDVHGYRQRAGCAHRPVTGRGRRYGGQQEQQQEQRPRWPCGGRRRFDRVHRRGRRRRRRRDGGSGGCRRDRGRGRCRVPWSSRGRTPKVSGGGRPTRA